MRRLPPRSTRTDTPVPDTPLVRSILRERPHRAARLIGVFQPVEEHMVIGGVVADARAAAMLLEQIGCIGHRFHAASDDQVDAARRQRLETGRASRRERGCMYV